MPFHQSGDTIATMKDADGLRERRGAVLGNWVHDAPEW
jgi:hypothetical protein